MSKLSHPNYLQKRFPSQKPCPWRPFFLIAKSIGCLIPQREMDTRIGEKKDRIARICYFWGVTLARNGDKSVVKKHWPGISSERGVVQSVEPIVVRKGDVSRVIQQQRQHVVSLFRNGIVKWCVALGVLKTVTFSSDRKTGHNFAPKCLQSTRPTPKKVLNRPQTYHENI